MAKPIKVTVIDQETGASDSAEIMDDYVIICAGNRYIANTEVYNGGTHVVTIKVDSEARNGD